MLDDVRLFWGLVRLLFQRLWLYFALSLVISAVLKQLIHKQDLAHWCLTHERGSLSSAAVLGVVSPLCFEGTIPFVLSLHEAGVPLSVLVAFLVSSPLMNPRLFVLTWAVLGWKMAIARLLTAIVLGLAAGYIVRKGFSTPMVAGMAHAGRRYDKVAAACTTGAEVNKAAAGGNIGERIRLRFSWQAFGADLCHQLRFVGKYFLISIALAALIEMLVPFRWISVALGRRNPFAVLWASVLGIPLYVCGGGTVPIVRSLMDMGMTGGSALAFFISGAATKPSNFMTIWVTFGRSFAIFFTVLVFAGALSFGLLYNLVGG